MDFSNDILMTDPFLTLDTDLEDVSAVIRNNMSDQPGILDSSPTPSPEYRHDNDFRADFKLSPPDPSKEREIGQIVSLLQDDMNINYNSRYMEPYGFNEGFNHFDSTQQNSLANGYHHVSAPNLVRVQQQFQQLPTQVLTQPGPQGYQQPGGYQRLSSTPQQYVSPGVDQQLYVTTNFYDPHQQIVPSTSYVSPAPATGMNSIQFQVQNGSTINTTSPTTQNYPLDGELKVGHPLDGDQNTLSPTTNTPTSPNVNSTKKELIRMLLEMTPSEFENLRAGKGRESLLRSKARNSDTALSSRAKPSGVATKMTKLGPISPVSAIDPMDTGIAPLSVSRQFSSPLVSPTLLSAHSVDWREDESDTETDFQPPSRKAPKTERRTAHNLIEKKYRCSINDRIVLLKEMLAPEEVKVVSYFFII
uniref:BHLH domain-containing protein n=2 Tax=Acrobeloides nanus TaxID=290746 RepID=A0A914C6Y0_9BILA